MTRLVLPVLLALCVAPLQGCGGSDRQTAKGSSKDRPASDKARRGPADRTGPKAPPAKGPGRDQVAGRGEVRGWFLPLAQLSTAFPPTTPTGRPQPRRDKVDRGGEALAVLDADGDGRQDIVVVNGTDFFTVALNQAGPDGRPWFRQRDQLVGPAGDDLSHRAKGLGVHDVDHDGLLDLWLATQGRGGLVTHRRDPPNDKGLFRDGGQTTWRSEGDGTFTPLDVGLDGPGSKRTAVFGDLDGDGHTDAYVSVSSYYGPWYAGGTEPGRLLPGTAQGFGPDVRSTAFEVPEGFWTDDQGRSVKNFKAAILRDLDGDGRAELVAGSIADVWANHELEVAEPGPEGYQGDWDRGLYLFHNRSEPGRIRMVEVSHEAMDDPWGRPHHGHVHSVVALDLDHDGDFDLVASGNRGRMSHGTLTHRSPILRVLRNDSTPGTLRFADITDEAGLGWLNGPDEGLPAPYPIRTRAFDTDVVLYPALMAAVPVDLNLDGHMDVVAVDRQTFTHDPVTEVPYGLHPWVLLGDGEGGFTTVPPGEHGLSGTARDVSTGDFDGDGRPDLVFVDGSTGGQFVSDSNRVYLHRGPTAGGWLTVRVVRPGDRFGIGTRVTLRDPADGAVVGLETVRTDFSYRSKRDAVVHLGLGDHETVDVDLRLPDGTAARLPGVPADTAVTVVQQPVRTTPQGRRWVRSTAVSSAEVFAPDPPPGTSLVDVDGDGRDDLVLSDAGSSVLPGADRAVWWVVAPGPPDAAEP